MKVLATGATGRVGATVVQELLKRGIAVRVLVHESSSRADLPASVEIASGDLLDPLSVEAALKVVDKLFLMNAVAADELTQALIAVLKAKKLGIKHVVYLSALCVDRFREVPHLASKRAVEDALRESGLGYTILRPGYFSQNDLTLKEALVKGIYASPIGNTGISAVDVRDIGEAAAIALADDLHMGQTYGLLTSERLTGTSVANLWATALGRTVQYAGENLDAWEKNLRNFAPAWRAFAARLMFELFPERSFIGSHADYVRFCGLLGHEPRTYEEFVREAAAAWRQNTTQRKM